MTAFDNSPSFLEAVDFVSSSVNIWAQSLKITSIVAKECKVFHRSKCPTAIAASSDQAQHRDLGSSGCKEPRLFIIVSKTLTSMLTVSSYDKGPIVVTGCDKDPIPVISYDKSLVAVTRAL
jgi:hypothetical protein